MTRQKENTPPAIELLTTAQAARVLNVHPNTVRNWADSALLPSYRIGPRRDRRFRRSDVESMLTEPNGLNGNGG